MDYTDVFHINGRRPSICKLSIPLDIVLRVPSGIKTRTRQGQELFVIGPHEVHERFLPWSDASASSTPVFPECDITFQVVDQNESRIQGDHFGQFVLSESLCPR